MQKVSEITQQIFSALKQNPLFAQVDFCLAFPPVPKPTRLKRTVVAIALAGVTLSDISVGDMVKEGTYQLSFTVYCRCDTDKAQTEQLLCDLLCSVFAYNLCGASVSPTVYDSTLDCLCTQAVLTFHDEMDFGDECNE